MQTIPVQAVPSQTLNVSLGGQLCTINLYQKSTGFYCDLYINNVLVIGGVICQNMNRIVRDAYLGFIGDLAFVDTQAKTDPYYTGLGARYIFVYLAPGDVVPGYATE